MAIIIKIILQLTIMIITVNSNIITTRQIMIEIYELR